MSWPFFNPFTKYARWLHTQWPAGTVERWPAVAADGSTDLSGVYIVGDLRGIPLLKFAADSGAKAVRTICADRQFQSQREIKGAGSPKEPFDAPLDLVIVGGGVAGVAAAIEAQKHRLRFALLEGTEAFSTILNFPKAKPIYTYPMTMKPEGDLQVSAEVKEKLAAELLEQLRVSKIEPRRAFAEFVRPKGDWIEVALRGEDPLLARRVILALGRSGSHHKLGVEGESLPKVYNRLHDPKDFAGRDVLVVGGGDSALETAIALSDAGARVTICHRKPEFSRPKSDNIDRVRQLELDGKIRVFLSARVKEIREREVLTGDSEGREVKLLNDVVFTMIGREAPLEFFRRSGVPIRGEWSAKTGLAFAAFLIFCLALFNLKGGGWLGQMVSRRGWFPASVSRAFGEQAADPKSLMGVIVRSASSPSFYYTIVYSAIVVVFGIRRIRRRKTPYITAQTLTFMAIQVFPLFLLPEIILPWLGNNGWIPRAFLDSLFPAVNYGHGREYWRAYGLILAWPLFIYNVFTSAPLWGWLAISFVQTFVIIPGMIYFWGKGAYCGWICSCGALAETLGDNHRQKMPHGPFWSRLNMAGQVILALALILFLIRVWGWIAPESWVARSFNALINGTNYRGELINPVNYKWIVDVGLSGVLGIGCYFWFSGRVWCRFFCPLAALMHIYARFSRFRILADKKKCISCNVCTSVCHQGIDVMNFANKGLAMEDPECVRCSACVHDCPTGVLAFGQVDRGGKMIRTDRLAASPVQMREEG